MKPINNPQHLSSYFKKEKKVLFFITLSGIIYNVGMSVGPFFEGKLVQMLYDVMHQKQTVHNMMMLALTYVIVIILIQGARSIKRFYVRRFANNVSRNMRHLLYNSLVYMPYREMKEKNVGDIMTRAISDVDACVEGMRKFTTEIFDTGVVLVVYLGVMFSYDFKLTLLSCAFIPLAYLIANQLKKKITIYIADSKKSMAALNNATLDRVNNSLTYRIFSRVENRSQAYETSLSDYELKAIQANIWETSMKPIYHMISMTGVIFLLAFGTKNVLGNGNVLWNLASFTTYLSCFTKMAVKSSSAAKLMNAIQKAQVSWKRIQPLMKPMITPNPQIIQKMNEKDELKVNHLKVSYDKKIIIEDLSFKACTGQIIGISGAVASGKSTFGKAFLFEPTVEGEISINQIQLNRDNQQNYIGYMGHHSQLLSGSVYQNITLGKKEDIQSILEFVGLDKELYLDDEIGEEGNQLSGGQKARLALARTLYHDKPILILDDPFASVDLENEKRMILEMVSKKSNHIILLITHRITHFPLFDQIIWLEEKPKVSTHQKLMKENERYASIYRLQGGEENE